MLCLEMVVVNRSATVFDRAIGFGTLCAVPSALLVPFDIDLLFPARHVKHAPVAGS